MEKILKAIKCSICRNILVSPLLLPCHHSVCQRHVDEAINELITCNECGSDHQKRPNFPFPINMALAQIIEAQIAALDLGETHTDAKRTCEKLETVIKECEQLLNDPDNFTYKEINELERQLHLRREELKKTYRR